MNTTTRLLLIPLMLNVGLSFAEEARLLREPDISADTLVFSYARDIWRVPLEGGEATRISSFQGREAHPRISPDGQSVAFTGEYDGNLDVYVTALAGGEPKRLTFHPGEDTVVGWSPDGRSVLFNSPRSNAPRGWQQLFTVSVDGGMPRKLPMNRALQGSFSADGSQLVFRRSGLWDEGFRNYRGGQNQALRVIDLGDLSERDLPWDNSLDLAPQWNGDHIYYLSNASQVVNVFRAPATGGEAEQLTHHTDWDVKGFAVNGNRMVYEHHGSLYFKPLDGETREISISVSADFPWTRPHWEDVTVNESSANVSPTGKRALFEARGDVFTVPAEHGDARNLSNTSGSRETGPAWSNDGQSTAWFSDASGEYRLVIADQYGKLLQEIELAETGFYYELQFSPDDQYALFSDQRQQLWVADLEKGRAKVFTEQPVVNPDWTMSPSWSPDSRYIAYAMQGDSFFRSLYVYNVKEDEIHRLTEGMADVRYPVWDKSGDILWLAVSTDFGPAAPWLDLTTVAFSPSYGIYYVLLNGEAKSPLASRSDDETEKPGDEEEEEEEEDKKDNGEEKEKVEVKIDFDGIANRMLPLGVAGRIGALQAGKVGELFYLKTVNDKTSLNKYSTKDRESKELVGEANLYRVSADGKQILVQSNDKWQIFKSAAPLDKEAKTLNMKLSKFVDNAAEWQQMFREAWRFQRDFFYVTNLHGVDWDAVYAAYQPLVAHVRHASDMTYLLDNMGAETSVGHSFTSHGDLPDTPDSKTGLLGADLKATDGGFEFGRIFLGESWYPDEQSAAPFAKIPGQVQAGDVLKAINGQPLDTGSNLHEALRGTVGKQTRLTIARDGRDEDANVTVVPIDNEEALRRNAWVEDNRRRVDEASGGKLAYVWVPNTAEMGFTYFNRYFFAQSQRDGVIVDERFNHGGYIAEYFIDVLRREKNGYFNNVMAPDRPVTSPGAGIWGAKVMLINEVSGSGGDMLPFMFRFYDVGPLVGKRTWGGLVGIWGVPALVDGAYITAPRSGYYNLDGEWQVENEGIAPDVEVEQWTRETAAGHDPQLEKAIEIAMAELEANPPKTQAMPADPVRVPHLE